MGRGERLEQRRLAGVGRADQHPLAGALAAHVARIEAVTAAMLRVLAFLLELRDAVLEVGLKLVRALVLGKERHHLAQRLELLLVALRLAVALLGFLVLRGEIRGHGGGEYRQPEKAASTDSGRRVRPLRPS